MLLCEQLKSSSVRLDVSEEVVWVQGEVGAQAEVGAQGEIVKRRHWNVLPRIPVGRLCLLCTNEVQV